MQNEKNLLAEAKYAGALYQLRVTKMRAPSYLHWRTFALSFLCTRDGTFDKTEGEIGDDLLTFSRSTILTEIRSRQIPE